MPAGAPYGNRNAENMQVKFTKELNKKDFKNEKEYSIYIEDNIELVCHDTLRLGKLISYEKQKSIEKQSFGGTKQRVDYYVIGSRGTALLELKNPINCFSEMRNAIAQLLYYGSLAKAHYLYYDKLCLISPIYDTRLFLMIKEYSLPIHLFYVTKSHNGEIKIL